MINSESFLQSYIAECVRSNKKLQATCQNCKHYNDGEGQRECIYTCDGFSKWEPIV